VTNLREFPTKDNWAYPIMWKEAFERELLEELKIKINPAYDGWNNLEDDAKISVYLRVLGFKDKKEAWKTIKELEKKLKEGKPE